MKLSCLEIIQWFLKIVPWKTTFLNMSLEPFMICPLKHPISHSFNPLLPTHTLLCSRTEPFALCTFPLPILFCFPTTSAFPGGSAGKESACTLGDLGLIPGLWRFPGEGKGYPLQYSGLENSMDCLVHGVAKNQMRLSNFHFHSLLQQDSTQPSVTCL